MDEMKIVYCVGIAVGIFVILGGAMFGERIVTAFGTTAACVIVLVSGGQLLRSR